MVEYKMVEVKKEQAEDLMNKMAADGWKVTSTSYWMGMTVRVLVTFEKEKAE